MLASSPTTDERASCPSCFFTFFLLWCTITRAHVQRPSSISRSSSLKTHPRAFEQLQKRLRECKQANVDLAREILKGWCLRIFLLLFAAASSMCALCVMFTLNRFPSLLSHSHRYEANRKTLEISRTARLCPNP